MALEHSYFSFEELECFWYQKESKRRRHVSVGRLGRWPLELTKSGGSVAVTNPSRDSETADNDKQNHQAQCAPLAHRKATVSPDELQTRCKLQTKQ